MKRNKIILLTALLLAGFTACEEYDIFKREQYKNVFALLSDDGYNIFKVVYDLDKGTDVGYLAASVGGTITTEEDINITLVEDESLLTEYNQDTYTSEIWKYAIHVPTSKYKIEQMSIRIPAGERGGKTAVTVTPEGLSPDSTYFIPIRANSYSAYEINPKKNTVLFQVQFKNRWATQETTTNYTFRGIRDAANVSGTKRLDPLTKNRVRIFVGAEAFESNLTKIYTYAIILDVADNGKVTILPYKAINVKQVDDDPLYPNKYFIDDDGFKKYKTFLLRYDYTIGNTTYQMKEELRTEYKEEEKK
ncbi:MAG: DUF1735 domain-containing protein [Tannerella sp.]|jgi:hypothetical protein|nr:DUF1735 domain-containing protein [Tannerella sp.]